MVQKLAPLGNSLQITTRRIWVLCQNCRLVETYSIKQTRQRPTILIGASMLRAGRQTGKSWGIVLALRGANFGTFGSRVTGRSNPIGRNNAINRVKSWKSAAIIHRAQCQVVYVAITLISMHPNSLNAGNDQTMSYMSLHLRSILSLYSCTNSWLSSSGPSSPLLPPKSCGSFSLKFTAIKLFGKRTVWNFALNVSKISFHSPWFVRLRLGAQPMQCFESNWLWILTSA